ncbi:MAG: manganese efflux pump [Oscillospiraceae bacterium]|nr:manganese efflux pump [Oscillospiraceae bacterium]
MTFAELFLIAVGLSMDAFAVSIGNGTVIKRRRKAVFAALMFGVFQAGMPLIGYFLGAAFAELIKSYAPLIALGVLGIIGGKMIVESIAELRSKGSDSGDTLIKEPGIGTIMIQAVATSIDALIVGVSFAAVGADILPAVSFIGVVTFVISLVGVFGGVRFGQLLGAKASLLGGAVLVAIGIKTFVQSLLSG